MARDPRANSFSCILPSFLMRWFKFCFTLCSEFASSFLIVVQNDLNILHRYSIKMFYFLLMLLPLNSFSYLTLVVKWVACWLVGPAGRRGHWINARPECQPLNHICGNTMAEGNAMPRVHLAITAQCSRAESFSTYVSLFPFMINSSGTRSGFLLCPKCVLKGLNSRT